MPFGGWAGEEMQVHVGWFCALGAQNASEPWGTSHDSDTTMDSLRCGFRRVRGGSVAFEAVLCHDTGRSVERQGAPERFSETNRAGCRVAADHI